MKNFLLVAATLLAATFVFTDAAVAGGGKSKVAVQNVNTNGGRAITVWVVDANVFASNPTISKADLLRLERKNIQAGRTDLFTRRNGGYAVVAADTQYFNSIANSTQLAFFANGDVFLVESRDVSISVKTAGAAPSFIPARPTIN